MTLPQARSLVSVTLRQRTLTLDQALAIVHYRQHRNYAAYRSHRKRTLRKYRQYRRRQTRREISL